MREVGGAASTLLRCLLVPGLRDTESSLPNTFLARRRLFYLLPANANHPGKVPPSLAAAQQLDLFNCHPSLLLLQPEQSRAPPR